MKKLIAICSALILSIAMSAVVMASTVECSNYKVRAWYVNKNFVYTVYVKNFSSETVQVTVKWRAPMASDDDNVQHSEIVTLGPGEEQQLHSGSTNSNGGSVRGFSISCY